MREAGGYRKVPAPFAEFQWADYFRTRINEKFLRKHFHQALKQAIALASHKDATGLPGCLIQSQNKPEAGNLTRLRKPSLNDVGSHRSH